MEINITNKGAELTKNQNLLIQRKLSKIKRHFDGLIETKIEITEEATKSHQDRFLVRVYATGGGTQLRGEVRGETVLSAIDKVVNIMERQVERRKGKLQDKKVLDPFIVKYKQVQETATPPDREFISKQLDIKPMAVEEAAAQMELLGYNFFFFRNADTENLSLIYLRKDGNYGIIEPERG